jgi:septal ring-binding cell division protein DamX
MNKKDLTKKLLESVAEKFNTHLIAKDDPPIPTGAAAKDVTKADLQNEIKEVAEAMLQEGDEQYFTAKDFEILTFIGVDLKECGLVMTPDQGTKADKTKPVEDEEGEVETKPKKKAAAKPKKKAAAKPKKKAAAKPKTEMKKQSKQPKISNVALAVQLVKDGATDKAFTAAFADRYKDKDADFVAKRIAIYKNIAKKKA